MTSQPLGSYMVVEQQPDMAGRKTHVWCISSVKGGLLGKVKWFARWRRYAFHPANGAVFDAACLDDIKEFLLGKRGVNP